jgi:hypothetical protein
MSAQSRIVTRMAAPRRTEQPSHSRLSVRVSPQERKRIEQAAKSRGMSTSDYVRGTALGLSPSTNGSTRSRGAANP